MSLVEWVPISEKLAQLSAKCMHCLTWVPLGDAIEWHNVLALTYCYICIDCLSDPLVEAEMRVHGWSRPRQ